MATWRNGSATSKNGFGPICQAGDAAWHWANEDYDTADRIAVRRRTVSKRVPACIVATGFNGWGISNGTAAGMLMADRFAVANPWTTLDPMRRVRKDFNKEAIVQLCVFSRYPAW